MAEVAGSLLKHRKRLNEVVAVLARHGLASWAARGGRIAGLDPVERTVRRVVPVEELEKTDGERLRGALTELGTTYIKFGQMLSLRPDVVGEDVADELEQAAGDGARRSSGVAQRNAEAQLGAPGHGAVRLVRPRAVRVGLGRPGAPGRRSSTGPPSR